MGPWRHSALQHAALQYMKRDIQHNAEHCYAKCYIQALYAECHYADCRSAKFIKHWAIFITNDGQEQKEKLKTEGKICTMFIIKLEF
jgi:hypothetical protein